LIYQ
jgi:hypothetical protein